MTAATCSASSTHLCRSWLPRAAGVGFAVSWIAGLALFTSSTQVRSSGAQILRSDTGHQAALTVQYVLTEGVPALLLALVVTALAHTIARRADASRRLVLAGGLAAAAVSLVELAIGLALTLSLVPERAAAAVGTAADTINRLDGVKMLLLAIVAVAAARAIARGAAPVPRWLGHLAGALAATLTLSAIGYLTRSDTFAAAAWLSLPCLIVFVAATGVAVGRPGPISRG